MRVVAVDCETTGLGLTGSPPREDGVVSVGLAWKDRGSEVVKVFRCNPGEHLFHADRAAGAFAVNRFTPADVRGFPPALSVAVEVAEVLEGFGSFLLVSHNEPFDRSFLAAPPFCLPLVDGFSGWRCTMAGSISRLGYSVPRLLLSKSCERLGVSFPSGQAHDAGVDALACLRLARVLGWCDA